MPANVSDSVRVTVTAGLANEVDDVNQYAPPMYAATAPATRRSRPDRTSAKTRNTKPNVADDLADELALAFTDLRADIDGVEFEHQVGNHCSDGATCDLGGDVGGHVRPWPVAQHCFGERHHRVEMSPTHRTEHHNDGVEDTDCCGRIRQKLQTNIVGQAARP